MLQGWDGLLIEVRHFRATSNYAGRFQDTKGTKRLLAQAVFFGSLLSVVAVYFYLETLNPESGLPMKRSSSFCRVPLLAVEPQT